MDNLVALEYLLFKPRFARSVFLDVVLHWTGYNNTAVVVLGAVDVKNKVCAFNVVLEHNKPARVVSKPKVWIWGINCCVKPWFAVITHNIRMISSLRYIKSRVDNGSKNGCGYLTQPTAVFGNCFVVFYNQLWKVSCCRVDWSKVCVERKFLTQGL